MKVKVSIKSVVKKIGAPYLWEYNRSEVETLLVGRIWWEIDADPIFDLDCHTETSRCHNNSNIRHQSLNQSVICGHIGDFSTAASEAALRTLLMKEPFLSH